MQIPVDKLKTIVRGVARTQEQEYSCDDVYQLLDEFTEAVAQGKDVAKLMPLVQQHLEMCPDCHEEFEALLQVVRATQSEA
jgi:DNA-binding FrmR family transcriptional regulator